MGYNDRENKKGGNSKGEKSLPEGYVNERGYFLDEEKEKMNPDFILNYAKDISKSLYEGREKNAPTQIRKYYEFIIRVKEKLKIKKDFSSIEADFLQIISRVEYAKNRGNVSKLFQDFINTNVKWVKSEQDLTAFLKHFQAVIGFMRK